MFKSEGVWLWIMDKRTIIRDIHLHIDIHRDQTRGRTMTIFDAFYVWFLIRGYWWLSVYISKCYIVVRCLRSVIFGRLMPSVTSEEHPTSLPLRGDYLKLRITSSVNVGFSTKSVGKTIWQPWITHLHLKCLNMVDMLKEHIPSTLFYSQLCVNEFTCIMTIKDVKNCCFSVGQNDLCFCMQNEYSKYTTCVVVGRTLHFEVTSSEIKTTRSVSGSRGDAQPL
jgi:hypothetical protein